MSWKEILEYELINTKNNQLTVSHLLATLIIFGAVIIFLYIIRRIFRRQEVKSRLDIGTSHAIYMLIKYLLWTVAIVVSLDTLGIKIAFLLASSAALLVGLGLGLQKIFQDSLPAAGCSYDK